MSRVEAARWRGATRLLAVASLGWGLVGWPGASEAQSPAPRGPHSSSQPGERGADPGGTVEGGNRDAYARTERAYLELDFESVLRNGRVALSSGALDPRQLVQLHRWMGTAASLLGRYEEARAHFERMLALDPHAEPDDSIPPEHRAPFFEARGAWAARGERPGLRVGVDGEQPALVVRVRDPLHLISTVRVGWRLLGTQAFHRRREPVAPAVRVPLDAEAASKGLEYFVSGLDEHSNVVFREGEPLAPKRWVPRKGGEGAPSTRSETSWFARPWFWIGVGAAALAGAAVGGYFFVERQQRIEGRLHVETGGGP